MNKEHIVKQLIEQFGTVDWIIADMLNAYTMNDYRTDKLLILDKDKVVVIDRVDVGDISKKKTYRIIGYTKYKTVRLFDGKRTKRELVHYILHKPCDINLHDWYHGDADLIKTKCDLMGAMKNWD